MHYARLFLNPIDLTDKESTKMSHHKILFALMLGLTLTACGDKPSAQTAGAGADTAADTAQAAADAAAAAADADAAEAETDERDADTAEDSGN